jgi:hypothetical protein
MEKESCWYCCQGDGDINKVRFPGLRSRLQHMCYIPAGHCHSLRSQSLAHLSVFFLLKVSKCCGYRFYLYYFQTHVNDLESINTKEIGVYIKFLYKN